LGILFDFKNSCNKLRPGLDSIELRAQGDNKSCNLRLNSNSSEQLQLLWPQQKAKVAKISYQKIGG
jgi:hypothetical protein